MRVGAAGDAGPGARRAGAAARRRQEAARPERAHQDGGIPPRKARLRAVRHTDRLLVAYAATPPSGATERPAGLATWAIGRYPPPERPGAPIQQGHDVAP
ncbi:hypothetical protein GCM10009680_51100 [Streptomyces yatensis]|uniref:Uncharacterized protein n=1 Tax=Streptomyces yatensis TaxID=155177 RepID=A0ABN2IFB5_9ACTN